jgi:hypothetical protein
MSRAIETAGQNKSNLYPAKHTLAPGQKEYIFFLSPGGILEIPDIFPNVTFVDVKHPKEELSWIIKRELAKKIHGTGAIQHW